MIWIALEIPGAWLIMGEPERDARGSYTRLWDVEAASANGVDCTVAQEGLSVNPHLGTLRGLHYQQVPAAETKRLQLLHGSIFDVLVDLRDDSQTYRKPVSMTITAETPSVLVVPPGVAHGFQTLEPDVTISYRMSAPYTPTLARGVRWNDAALDIHWPLSVRAMSDQDRRWPLLRPLEALSR